MTMRDLMMIVEGAEPSIRLVEGVEEVTVLGKTIQVFRNPSAAALLAAATRKSMRGLVDAKTGDTYWWNASLQIHPVVEKALGIRDTATPWYHDGANARVILKGKALDVIDNSRTVVASASIHALAQGGLRIKRGIHGETISLEEFALSLKARDRPEN